MLRFSYSTRKSRLFSQRRIAYFKRKCSPRPNQFPAAIAAESQRCVSEGSPYCAAKEGFSSRVSLPVYGFILGKWKAELLGCVNSPERARRRDSCNLGPILYPISVHLSLELVLDSNSQILLLQMLLNYTFVTILSLAGRVELRLMQEGCRRSALT